VGNNSNNKEKVLIVEDSASYAKILQYKITKALKYECDIAENFFEAKKFLTEKSNNYFIAISDLNLPDCKPGEVADYILSRKISCIIVTGDFNEKIRQGLIKKSIIDYVVKKDMTIFEHIIKLIERTIKNQKKKILIVDDSASTRFMINNLLKAKKFQIFEAKNGEDALNLLDIHSDIDLIITDYNMPVMDGFTLVRKVREMYSKEEMGIIGISAEGSGLMSAKFLKNGANDFLTKPFYFEEFSQRIAQNIEILEYTKALKTTAITDYLTGLYNRRYFFEEGKKIFERNISEGNSVSIAMLDIDNFKKINDKYGHDGGDEVLKKLAMILDGFLTTENIIARLGGEEFCIITTNIDPRRVLYSFEKLRTDKNFTEAINGADKRLYRAKETGKNKIIA